jgi:hypothetical protein
MKKSILRLSLFVAAIVFGPLRADAQSTYTTTNGTVNLVAGLTNLTSVTAINTTNQATGISYITDSSWSTGIFDLGGEGNSYQPNNGTLAGTFGGGIYFANSSSILLLGLGSEGSWGGWTVRLLLSNDSYSPAISYTNTDLVHNLSVPAQSPLLMLGNTSGDLVTITDQALLDSLGTRYQVLNIADFDSGNLGVKGIEMSGLTVDFPDITYIGVAEPVPEPSTYALLALSAAGLGGCVLRRRRK